MKRGRRSSILYSQCSLQLSSSYLSSLISSLHGSLRTFLPGFAHDVDFAQLVTAMRIMLFSPFFLGLSNFFSSVTQMNRRFLIYSLSPILYNVGMIIGAVVFYRYLGLAGLVWGVALGACIHMAVQIPFIIKTNAFHTLSGKSIGRASAK